MPTIEENLNHWTHYDWGESGDEWSEVWGGTENLWRGSLLPRIQAFLPTGAALEIAPGFGRITQYLKDQCDELMLVDLAERCIDACRERFAGERHLDFSVNDGKSLPAVADRSIDFAFTFDSLVHVEIEVIRGYLEEFVRILKPNGVAFIHHSNIAAFQDLDTGKLSIPNEHWRGSSVSADLVAEVCDEVGLSCFRQELVNWGCPHLTDCFSQITPSGSIHAQKLDRVENPGFMDEALNLGRKAKD